MEHGKKTVKDLRVLAKTLGIKPIPRLKKDLISAVVTAEGSNGVEGSKVMKKDATDVPPVIGEVIKCSGAGVTKRKLRESLSEAGLLAAHRSDGLFLSFSELQKICMGHRSDKLEGPKESQLPEIDEEKILAENKFALIIKEQDPDLYEAVKNVATFIPNPRRTLTDAKGSVSLDVEWKPWMTLYDEINDLFAVTDESTGSRMELKEILDFLQDSDAKYPEKATVRSFTALFPVLSYVYAHSNVEFRWLLAFADVDTPFLLSNLVPDDQKHARIPYLLRPVKAMSTSFYGAKLRDIENDNPNDMARLIKYAHRIHIFKHGGDSVYLESYIAKNAALFKTKRHLGVKSIFLEYLRTITPETHTEWMDVALYTLSSLVPTYEYLYKLALTIRKNGFRLTDTVRDLVDRVPQPTALSVVESRYEESKALFGYAILLDRPEVIRKVVQAALATRSPHHPLFSIFRDALMAHSYDIVGDIIKSGLVDREDMYVAILQTLDDENLEIIKEKGFDVDIEDAVRSTILSQGAKETIDGLVKLFKKMVDPKDPPEIIYDSLITFGGDIARVRVLYDRDGNVGWEDGGKGRFVSLMVEYGANVDEESLEAIKLSLVTPSMMPVIEMLIDRGVNVPLKFFVDPSSLIYATKHIKFTPDERITLLTSFHSHRRSDDELIEWVRNEVENNPLMTPEVLGAALSANNFGKMMNSTLSSIFFAAGPVISNDAITDLITQGDYYPLGKLFKEYDLTSYRMERPAFNVFVPSSKRMLMMDDFPEQLSILSAVAVGSDRRFGKKKDFNNQKLLMHLTSLMGTGYKPQSGFLFYLFRAYTFMPRSYDSNNFRTSREQVLREALAAGADPNELLNHTSPLQFLVSLASRPERGNKGILKFKHLLFVDLLLEFGADINSVEGGSTALIEAVKAIQWGNLFLLERLIEAGADLELVDNKGKKALSYADNQGEKGAVALLIKSGASKKPYKYENVTFNPLGRGK